MPKQPMTDKTVSVPTESRPTAEQFLAQISELGDKYELSSVRFHVSPKGAEHKRDLEHISYTAEQFTDCLIQFAEAYAASSSLLPVPEPEVQRDNNRCAICAWPLIEGDGLNPLGCVRGNCSLRPHPEKFYDFDRAEREYGIKFDSKYRAGLPVGRQLSAKEFWEKTSHIAFEDADYDDIMDFAECFRLASLPVGESTPKTK